MAQAYITRGASLRITEALIGASVSCLQEHGAPHELVVRDVDLKGFVLRLRASGKHVYGVAYGRGKFLTLGACDRLSAGAARKAAREALAQTSLDGAPVRAERKAVALTLRAFLDEQYAPWASEHLKTSAETMARLRVNFESFLDLRLADLTPFGVERWRTARLKAGRAKATVNRDVVSLKAALARAVAWGHLKTHPIASVRPYRLDGQAVIRFLSIDEEERLVKALQDRDIKRREGRASANAWRVARGYPPRPEIGAYADHLTPIVVLALHTGLRRGELFGLCWRDVDLVRCLVTVRGAGAKSGRTRHVPLNSTAADALRIHEQSLRDLQTDRVDLLYAHCVGSFDAEQLLAPDGVFAGLREAQRRGGTRFIGFTAHHHPAKAPALLDRVEVDAVMLAMNYADRHTYDFEGRVLPRAGALDLGIACMKVYGGARGMDYQTPRPSALGARGHHAAFRYALGLPGVAVAVIGMYTREEIEQNAGWAARWEPLTPEEEARLAAEGRAVAAEWGPHFGDVE